MDTFTVNTISAGQIIRSNQFVSGVNAWRNVHGIEAMSYAACEIAKFDTDEVLTYHNGELVSVRGIGDDCLPGSYEFPDSMVTKRAA